MDRPGEPDHERHLTWGNWTNKNWSDLTSLLRNSFLLRSFRLLLPFPIFSEKQQHHHYSVPIKSEYTHFIKEIRMFLQTSNCLLSLRAHIHLRSVKAIFMQNLYNSLYILRQYLEDIIGLCWLMYNTPQAQIWSIMQLFLSSDTFNIFWNCNLVYT